MHENVGEKNKKRLRLLAVVLGAVLLIALCGAFVLLIKVIFKNKQTTVLV